MDEAGRKIAISAFMIMRNEGFKKKKYIEFKVHIQLTAITTYMLIKMPPRALVQKSRCGSSFFFFFCPVKINRLCSVQGDKDFTPTAAQVAHQKPLPGVPKHAPIQHIKPQIHQPRK